MVLFKKNKKFYTSIHISLGNPSWPISSSGAKHQVYVRPLKKTPSLDAPDYKKYPLKKWEKKEMFKETDAGTKK